MTIPVSTAAPGVSPVRERINTGIQLLLFFISLAGSFGHLAHLFVETGQTWPEAAITALVVDVGVYRFAQERQRDKRIGRKRRGPASLPTLFLFGAIAISLAGNAWDADLTPWGIIGAILPGLFLLASIVLTERQAAEDYRRAVVAAAEEDTLRQAEEAEARAAQAERGRQEAGRQAQAEEAARREADRARRAGREAQRRAQPGAGPGRAPGASEAQPGARAPMTLAQAEEHFVLLLASGEVPTIRAIRSDCGVGASKAAEYRQYFESVLAGNPGQPASHPAPLHLAYTAEASESVQ